MTERGSIGEYNENGRKGDWWWSWLLPQGYNHDLNTCRLRGSLLLPAHLPGASCYKDFKKNTSVFIFLLCFSIIFFSCSSLCSCPSCLISVSHCQSFTLISCWLLFILTEISLNFLSFQAFFFGVQANFSFLLCSISYGLQKKSDGSDRILRDTKSLWGNNVPFVSLAYLSFPIPFSCLSGVIRIFWSVCQQLWLYTHTHKYISIDSSLPILLWPLAIHITVNALNLTYLLNVRTLLKKLPIGPIGLSNLMR